MKAMLRELQRLKAYQKRCYKVWKKEGNTSAFYRYAVQLTNCQARIAKLRAEVRR